MSTITLHIPASEVGWFEQMIQTMGWTFTRSDSSSAVDEKRHQVITPALRRKINKARKEHAEAQTITCRTPQEMQQYFEQL